MHNSDIERLVRVNVTSPIVLTKYISRHMIAKKTGRIVNISSIVARTGYRGLAPYGASKAAMEAVVSVYGQELPCIVTRPFNYTGPGQATHFLVPKLVDHFARRAPRIELGNLDVERDFLDVRDVAGLYAALVDCEPVAGAVNLCSGQGTTLREIVARLERITGHVMDMQVNPQFVRSHEIPSLVGSDERLRALLGDAPRIGLDTTLRDMLDAARAVH
jgi:nucleoside-diphosphate-sugar epimerase